LGKEVADGVEGLEKEVLLLVQGSEKGGGGERERERERERESILGVDWRRGEEREYFG
jgi:hypothetical protein